MKDVDLLNCVLLNSLSLSVLDGSDCMNESIDDEPLSAGVNE